ncbi:MAG: hypothetical protein HYU70_10315 [Bacteroidetes bacterium]|nr:hypothetical protein [Bacteroidota bacterium]
MDSHIFHLYLLVNYDSLHDYPYVALSETQDVIISICDEHICIDKRSEAILFSEADYIPTSRNISVNMEKIRRLVELYMGTDECSILARFTEDQHVTLTYYIAPPTCQRIHDLYSDGTNMTADIVVSKLVPIMDEIREAANRVDD